MNKNERRKNRPVSVGFISAYTLCIIIIILYECVPGKSHAKTKL